MTDTKPDITVRENTTRAIDVLANVIGDATIAEIESQPGSPDSAEVVGGKIAYRSGPVVGPAERLERLTCLLRTTVTVAVKNVADVIPVGNANCYPATSSDTVTVELHRSVESGGRGCASWSTHPDPGWRLCRRHYRLHRGRHRGGSDCHPAGRSSRIGHHTGR